MLVHVPQPQAKGGWLMLVTSFDIKNLLKKVKSGSRLWTFRYDVVCAVSLFVILCQGLVERAGCIEPWNYYNFGLFGFIIEHVSWPCSCHRVIYWTSLTSVCPLIPVQRSSWCICLFPNCSDECHITIIIIITIIFILHCRLRCDRKWALLH